VRGRKVDLDTLTLTLEKYHAGTAEEHFISYVTGDDHLAGYLRLSFPKTQNSAASSLGIHNTALIREVHIYGQSLELGADQSDAAQHKGLGKDLIEFAEVQARRAGFERIAVISALGTRGYYRKLGYRLHKSYMVKALNLAG
jgi:elongator complex protein 3